MLSILRNVVFPRSKDFPVNAYVSWQSAPVTDSLIRKSLAQISTQISFVSKEDKSKHERRLLQWCDHDEMDHELAHFQPEDVLSSSYAFRTALVKEHHFLRAIQTYLTKNPESILKDVLPQSFEIEISFADELDEMWSDELYALGERLDSGASWWILKPGENSSNLSIKIFHTKEDLQDILTSFEENAPEEDDTDGASATVTSQSQHFIVQEYVMSPLLLDPSKSEKKIEGSEDPKPGCKFQLRAYCLANGDIQLYLHNQILVFFSSTSFEHLDSDTSLEESAFERNLGPHLTNPPRNPIDGNDVWLLHELEGAPILSGGQQPDKLKKSDIDAVVGEIKETLAEVFRAARTNHVNFQARSNAFELYAVDFLVSHTPSEDTASNPFHVKIVRVDAEPTFQFIGARINWVLEDLFAGIAKVCIEPFFAKKVAMVAEPWKIGEERHNLVKFMDEGE